MPNDTKQVGVDTGTPGFDIDGITRSFQAVEPGTPETTTPTQKGDMSVNVGGDIPAETLETLADYVGKKTAKNRYPIDTATTFVSTTTKSGVPTPLNDSINSHRHVERRDELRGTPLLNDPRETLVDNLSRGKHNPQKVDGNDLLKGSVGREVKEYVSAVLKNNRFTADARQNPKNGEPERGYDSTMIHPRYGEVKVSRLAQVGTALLLRASSEPGSNADGINPNSGVQQARSLLPGPNQLGVTKVDVELLRAKDVLDELTSQSIPDENYINIGSKSWGTLNNVQDQFFGLQAAGMIALSTAMSAAVIVVFEGISALVNVVGSAPVQTRDVNGRYLLGASSLDRGTNPSGVIGLANLAAPGNFTQNMFGIRPTTASFAKALKKGIEVFFGIDSGLTAGLRQVTQSPGYNVVVARSIVRSSAQIVEKIKNAFGSSTVVSGVRNVISIAEEIRGSRLIAAMNVFAQLGDQALTHSPNESIFGVAGEPERISSIDSIPDGTPGESVSKSRRSSGRTKLAWANNTTPSIYMLPTRVLGMSLATRLGGHQTGYGLQEEATRAKYKLLETSDSTSINGRIPYESNANDGLDVKTIEQELEAEYVPFYFHDLRTNEIISFHAFISSLDESFNPEYEETKGFGRSDAVQVYKGTGRELSVRFHVVSTSEDDFNDMWVKINKLITLVYPQYTQGRTVSAEGYEFVQPFSQMMSASPLIRLRIGDLIRSNYSRFALARLFGVGSKDTLKLNGQQIDFKLREDVVKQRVEALKRTEQRNWNTSVDGISVETLGKNLPLLGGVSQGYASTMSLGADNPFVTMTIVRFVDNDDGVLVQPKIIDAQDLVAYYGMSERAARAKVSYLRSVYDNRDAPKTRIVGGIYKIPTSALRISPMLASSVGDALSTTVTTQAALDALNAFMSPESNALVKSFESVKGKGLAGVIKGLQFDWMERATWETTPGSRAPKMCTVSFTYKPIHDIEPGLSSDGYNRSPLYPVGWFGAGIDEDKNGAGR